MCSDATHPPRSLKPVGVLSNFLDRTLPSNINTTSSFFFAASIPSTLFDIMLVLPVVMNVPRPTLFIQTPWSSILSGLMEHLKKEKMSRLRLRLERPLAISPDSSFPNDQ